jgi:anaerobic magnesium-protoporphyrin IX monomethyl ester cyclase
MKIALVNCKGPQGTMISIPQGILQLSAEAKARNHQVDIVDYNYIELPVSYDSLAKYDLVGLSTMSTQLPHAQEIADSIGNRAKIVWGGIHALLDPQSILSQYPDHLVVSGEGEVPLIDILDTYENRQSMEWLLARPGICAMQDGKPVINIPYYLPSIDDLEDINFYDLPNLEAYLDVYDAWFAKTIKMLLVLVARGCPYNCSFCINSVHRKHGGKYRVKSIEKIRRESIKVIEEFNIPFIQPRDELFFSNKKLVAGWLEFVREYNLLWPANCRFDFFREGHITADYIENLVESGCYSLGMSVESGNEQVRNSLLNKELSDSQIDHAIDVLEKSAGRKMTLGSSFVLYFPGDTRQNRIDTIKWMDRLSQRTNVIFSGPQIYRSYPGTDLYKTEVNVFQGGDISGYVEMLSYDGTEKSLASSPEAYFYSNMLPVYFNYRFRKVILTSGENEPPTWEVSDEANTICPPDLYWVMGIIRLRLKLNFWFLFIDPKVLPWIHQLIIEDKSIIGQLRKLGRQLKSTLFNRIWMSYQVGRLTPRRIYHGIRRRLEKMQ